MDIVQDRSHSHFPSVFTLFQINEIQSSRESLDVLHIRIKHGSFEDGSNNDESEIDHSSFQVKDYVFQLC